MSFHLTFPLQFIRSLSLAMARVTTVTARASSSPATLAHALLLFMFRRCTYPASHNLRAAPHRLHPIIFRTPPHRLHTKILRAPPHRIHSITFKLHRMTVSRLSFGMTSAHVLPCSRFRLLFVVQQHRHRFTLFDRPG